MSRKRIEVNDAENVLDKFNENLNLLSVRQYVEVNFDKLRGLEKSGATLTSLHAYLHSCNIDVGRYSYFCEVYRKIKKDREAEEKPIAAAVPEVNSPKREITAPSKAENEDTQPRIAKTKQPEIERQPLYGEKPLTMPDGSKVFIDPETGAKRFKMRNED